MYSWKEPFILIWAKTGWKACWDITHLHLLATLYKKLVQAGPKYVLCFTLWLGYRFFLSHGLTAWFEHPPTSPNLVFFCEQRMPAYFVSITCLSFPHSRCVTRSFTHSLNQSRNVTVFFFVILGFKPTIKFCIENPVEYKIIVFIFLIYKL